MRSGNFLRVVIFLIYLILGIYLINIQFNLIPIPTNNWIILIGGILLIVGGIKYLISNSIFRGYGAHY